MDGCEVCAHPKREEMEFEIWSDKRSNDDVARAYALDVGATTPLSGAEKLRLHRGACVTQAEIDLLRSLEDGFRHRERIIEELRARRAVG